MSKHLLPSLCTLALGAGLAACSGSGATQGDAAATTPTTPSTGGTGVPASAEAGRAGQAGEISPSGGAGGSAGSAGAAAMSGKAGATATGVTGGAGAAGQNGAAAGSSASAGQPATQPGMTVTSHPGVGPMQAKALGYGAMATGGGNAQPRAVGSLGELQAAIDAYSGSGGLVLEYTGSFDFKSISDPCVQHTLPAQKLELKNKSNVTILGKEGSAANFGIHIAAASENIIVRNMTIGLVPGGGDSDMISLEGMNSGIPRNIWIDHNELFSSLADCPGAGDTAFDGMVDVKKGVDNVTVSYNYLHDHHKVSLNGYSDDDSQTRHVTFHHNIFENIGSRTPLQRHGYSHIVNNLFNKVLVSAINVRMGGFALVEANYFEEVKNPVTSRDSDAVGFWELRDNNLAAASDVAAGNSFAISWDNGDKGTVNATDWSTTKTFPEQLGYTLKADPWVCVRDGLRAVAGASKKLATLTCDGSSKE